MSMIEKSMSYKLSEQNSDCDNIPIGESKDCEYCKYKIHSKEISKLNSCNDCLKFNVCKIKPDLGDLCRINCHAYVGKDLS